MMESSASPIIYDLVLVGCGHAHVHVLKMIGMTRMNPTTGTSTTGRNHNHHNHTTPPQTRGIRITIISSHYHTPYSGMLPGYIAGHYGPNSDNNTINLNVIQLARFAQVTFIHATVDRITYHRSNTSNSNSNGGGGYIYTTDHRPPIRYDCLSMDIGSAPSSSSWTYTATTTTTPTIVSNIERPTSNPSSSSSSSALLPSPSPPPPTYNSSAAAASAANDDKEEIVIPVKPIANLCQYWDTVVQQYQIYLYDRRLQWNTTNPTTYDSAATAAATSPYTIAIIGGGAGGVELALSIQYRFMSMTQQQQQQQQQQQLFQVILITRGNTILESCANRRLIRKFQRILHQRNIMVYYNARVDSVIPVSNHATVVFPTNEHGVTDAVNHNSIPTNSSSGVVTAIRSTTRPQKQIRFQPTVSPTNNNTTHPNTNATTSIMVDVCFSCITGTAASWLSDATPFTTTGSDQGNYLRVHPTYELIHHPGVFATGDCCHMDQHPRPKAGVFAVRAGPILFTNLFRYIFQNQTLVHHRPQSTYLSIISTGDKYAVACKGRHFCIEGQYVWHIKDYIDRKWMAKYSTDLPDLETMMKEQHQPHGHRWGSNLFHWPNTSKRRISSSKTWTQYHNKSFDAVEAFQDNPMRCGGCGSKVGATIVSRVLRNIHERQVIRAQELGYSIKPAPIDHDDAAITMLPKLINNSSSDCDNRGAIIQTIDYFREMISDPYTFGKVVAVHALSDVHAMGIRAQSALVLAVVPFAADDNITETTLLHLLSGVSDVLQDENVSLVGGHTCEGIELACGLSIQGFTDDPTKLWRKRGGRIGDQIILTKSIGTGALFAAEMRAKASGDDVAEAIQGMLESNYKASCAAREYCTRYEEGSDNVVHACTDVTGFGLIGHLLEMLLANETSKNVQKKDDDDIPSLRAVLNIKHIPFYRGGIAASKQQIYSSLQKQNERNRRAVYDHSTTALTYPIEYPLLFDPQTAGGLLFFVNPAHCSDFVSYLRREGNVSHVSIIGQVEAYSVITSNDTEQMVPSVVPETCIIGNHSGSSSTENRIRIVA